MYLVGKVSSEIYILQSIDLNQEMELFYSISNSALSVLVQDVESTCDAALQAMMKIK